MIETSIVSKCYINYQHFKNFLNSLSTSFCLISTVSSSFVLNLWSRPPPSCQTITGYHIKIIEKIYHGLVIKRKIVRSLLEKFSTIIFELDLHLHNICILKIFYYCFYVNIALVLKESVDVSSFSGWTVLWCGGLFRFSKVYIFFSIKFLKIDNKSCTSIN